MQPKKRKRNEIELGVPLGLPAVGLSNAPSTPVRTPKPQLKRSTPARTANPKRNFFQRTWDQFNFGDGGRTFKEAKPTKEPSSVINQIASSGAANVTRGIVKPVINTVTGTIVEPVRSLTARATGNEGAYRAAESRKRAAIDTSAPVLAGKDIYHAGKATRYLPETVKGIATNKPIKDGANIKGLEELNKSYLASFLQLPEKIITDKVEGAAEDSKRAGFDPEQPAYKAALMTGVGTLQAAAPAGGASRVIRNTPAAKNLRQIPRKTQENVLRGASKDAPVHTISRELVGTDGRIDRTRVDQYKQNIASGKPIEPIITMRDADGVLKVADGRNRYQAYSESGAKDIPIKIATPEAVRAVAEGGYAKLPSGSRDPAPDLTPQQKDLVNEYAEMLESTEASAQGGLRVPDGEGGYVRTSEHSPFYRRVYDEKGRAPTKAEYFDEARRQVEGGRAGFGASEEFAQLPRRNDAAPAQAITAPSPLELSRTIKQLERERNSEIDALLNDPRYRNAETNDSFYAATQQRIADVQKEFNDRLAPLYEQHRQALRVGRKPEPMSVDEAINTLESGVGLELVKDILDSSSSFVRRTEPDTPLPKDMPARDLLSIPELNQRPRNFIDLDRAPRMNELPARANPRPELYPTVKNIDEMPESGAQFNVGTRKGRNGEEIRVVESVKRSPRGGLETTRFSPDMPIATSVDDVLEDANLVRNTGEQITDKTVKQLRTNQKALLNEWLGTRTAAEIEAIKAAAVRELDDLPPEKHEAFVHAMEKDPSEWGEFAEAGQAFRRATDELYDLAEANGINMNRVRAYVTHLFDEKTLPKPDSPAAEKLLNPFHYGNSRELWRTYADAAEAGVKMRYKDPRKILAVYAAELHKTLADVSFIKRLKEGGVLIEAPAGSRPDLREVFVPDRVMDSLTPSRQLPDAARGRDDLPFSAIDGADDFGADAPLMEIGNTLYAEPKFAKVINNTLSPELDPSLGSRVLNAGAKASGALQDIGLSGGIWGTPVNAFAIAQLTKEMTAGRFKSPVASFLRSMTNKQANKYFADNQGAIKELMKEGVPFSSSYEIPKMGGYVGELRDANTFTQRAAATWDALVSDPTFKRFLPMMQVELFKDIKKGALKAGKSDREARKLAGKAVRNFYGLRDSVDSKAANQTLDDITSILFFAPKYRAAMARMWFNTLKSFANPADRANRTNLRFAAGALLTYGAMNAINYMANGTPMWNNPDGKEDKLLLPIGDGGKFVGVPWLSSIATVPRYAAKGFKHAFEGKGDETIQDVLGFASYMVRPIAENLINSNYFGEPIVDKEDDVATRLTKQTGHVVSNYLPTWIRENLRGFGQDLPEGVRDFLEVPASGRPLYQTGSSLLELPLRYYDSQYFRGQPASFRTAPGKSGLSFVDSVENVEEQAKQKREALSKLFGYEDNIIRGLSDDERDDLVNSGVLTEDKLRGLDKYELNQRRKLGMTAGDLGQGIPELAKATKQDIADFYNERSYVYDEDYEAWLKQPAEGAAAKLLERANGLAEGRYALPQTNEVAELFAEFDRKRTKEEWGETKETNEKYKLLKKAYKTGLSKQQQEWYGLSDASLINAVENGEISQEDMDALVAFDDALRETGIIGDIGNTFRDEYGYQEWHKGKRSSGGKSGGRSRGKGKSKLPELPDLPDTASALAAFRKLLNNATVGGNK